MRHSWRTTAAISRHAAPASGPASITPAWNSHLTASELAYIISNSDLRILITLLQN
jgi:hypothetical protein